MEQPIRITVKSLVLRYDISERTAVRWRKILRDTGLLVPVSPKAYSLVGQWSSIDQAVAIGSVGPRPLKGHDLAPRQCEGWPVTGRHEEGQSEPSILRDESWKGDAREQSAQHSAVPDGIMTVASR